MKMLKHARKFVEDGRCDKLVLESEAFLNALSWCAIAAAVVVFAPAIFQILTR